jgi:putative ABC transport system permease protein
MQTAIRKAIATADPDQPVLLSASMESFVADSVADRRFITALLTITAILSLVMATAGVYGVTLFATSRRTHEIGIRIALGATARDIHQLIFRQGFIPIALGLASGTVFSFALMRVLRSLVAGLDRTSFVPITLVVLIITTAAAIAFWIPTRRATLVDAATTLREEN